MNKGISMDKEWQARDDMETLMRAAEIQRDKDRMAAAKAMAKKRYAQLEAAGLCGDKKK